jgi:hypothetical protein
MPALQVELAAQTLTLHRVVPTLALSSSCRAVLGSTHRSRAKWPSIGKVGWVTLDRRPHGAIQSKQGSPSKRRGVYLDLGLGARS